MKNANNKSGNRSLELFFLLFLLVFGIYGVYAMGERKDISSDYDQHQIIQMSDDLNLDNTLLTKDPDSMAGR